jgi:CheY-like chemotaxis protein
MEVVEAGGALEGIEMAEREQPDAILLDVMMPGIDGAAALRMLRQNPMTRLIPVIFLTARTGDLDDALVRELGANGLLLKPFDPSTLPGRLTALLADAALPGA